MPMIAVGAKFNSDLYVVAATVIPVFFIALMMPGGTLRHWVLLLRGRHRDTRNDAWVRFKAGVAYLALVLGSVSLYLLFVIGEIKALTALDNQRATGFEHAVVLLAVELMAFAAAASAILHVLSEVKDTDDGSASDAEPAN